MPFQITITEVAEGHIQSLPARDQHIIEAAIVARLSHAPTTVMKSLKKLRPNPLAEYELRVRDFRVLYNVDVDSSQVVLLIIGRKQGNTLIVEGEEFHGHRSDPSQ